MDLCRSPPLGVILEQHLPCVRVDVVSGHQRCGDLVEPSHRIELAVEVTRMLATGWIAVPRAPATIGPLVHVRHRCPPRSAADLLVDPCVDILRAVAQVTSDATTRWPLAEVMPVVQGRYGDPEEVRDLLDRPQPISGWVDLKVSHGPLPSTSSADPRAMGPKV